MLKVVAVGKGVAGGNGDSVIKVAVMGKGVAAIKVAVVGRGLQR